MQGVLLTRFCRTLGIVYGPKYRHMDDTLQEREHPIKFSNKVFISLLYSKTILNG